MPYRRGTVYGVESAWGPKYDTQIIHLDQPGSVVASDYYDEDALPNSHKQ